jgi:hypothetical protein
MSNCELPPNHFRIFATWFRDTRRSQSAKQAKTFDGTGSSICHAIPISKLSPTTASYSKAVTSSLFGQERGMVRKMEPSLMGKSDANECNESSLSNCRVQLTLSTKKDGMILEKRLDDFRNQNLSSSIKQTKS